MNRAATLLLAALAAAGCAAQVPAPAPAPAPPAPVAATAAPPAAAVAAVPDSSPSPEALAVLATIPDPLGGVPAAPGSAVVPAPAAAHDSLRQASAALEVPVPAPTRPLVPPTPLPAAEPPAEPPLAAAAVAPDTCWRVQVAAPAEREKGKSVRDAAESLLMVPMIVDREGGRFKVRSRDCLSRRAAESLRARAVESGFKGVFLVRLTGAR